MTARSPLPACDHSAGKILLESSRIFLPGTLRSILEVLASTALSVAIEFGTEFLQTATRAPESLAVARA